MAEHKNINLSVDSNMLEVILSLGVSLQNLKDRIFLKLSNEEYSNVSEDVYRKHFSKDMIITYYLLLSDTGSQVRTMPLTNKAIKQFEIDIEELHNLALKNTKRMWPVKIERFDDKLKEFVESDSFEATPIISPADDMYFLTNIKNTFGASVILYPETLSEASAKVAGSRLYLIPESTNSWLFGSIDNVVNLCGGFFEAYDMLKKKILEANKTTFSDKTEILSNEPFYYDAINKKLLRFADMVAVSKVVNDLSVL